MTTRKITIIALIAGIVLGAAATEGFNVYRQSHDSQIFQERLRCKAVADAYVKEQTSTDPDHVFLTLDKVDYSPARNSCVTESETVYFGPRPVVHYSVEDLLSGETLFVVICAGCYEDVTQSMRLAYVDPAFDYVMNSASKPLELEKGARAFAKEESHSRNPIPDSKHPPESAPPSGH